MLLPVFLCLFLNIFAVAQSRIPTFDSTQLQNLAQGAEWLRLGHYRGSLSSGFQSEAIGLFLSPNGEHDPQAELAATLEAFYSPEAKIEEKSALCRFPARMKYLSSAFALTDLPQVNCEKYSHWREAINASGAELVFASAFVNSPSSMYGHTMLKFPRAGKTAGNPLLDYTLSFGAETGGSGGLGYMIKGLVGGFKGYFATAPFYLKVQEYNNVENRDFWIYPFHLSADELDMMLAHTWELKNVGFSYFFLKKNCAYYLLELVEVARPALDLTAHFPLWSVPVDTIRLLQKDGILGEPIYRASRYARLLKAREALTSEEKQSVKQVIRESSKEELSMPALNAAYEYFRYRAGAGNHLSASDRELQTKLLAELSQSGNKLPDVSVTTPLAPEKGHLSSRAFLGAGMEKTSFYDFGYRGTLHDLLDAPDGYEKASELSMGDFRGRVERGRVFLEHSDILKIRSIPAYDSWAPKTAWNVRIGSDREKDFDCSDWHCIYGTIDGGAGLGFNLFSSTLFAMGNFSVDGGPSFQKGYRVGVGPSIGYLVPLFSWWRILVEYDQRFHLLGEHLGLKRIRAEQSWILRKSLEIRIRGEAERAYHEGALGFYYLF